MNKLILFTMLLIAINTVRAQITLNPLDSDLVSLGPSDQVSSTQATGGSVSGSEGSTDTGTTNPIIQPALNKAITAQTKSLSAEATPLAFFFGLFAVALIIMGVKKYNKLKKYEEKEENDA